MLSNIIMQFKNPGAVFRGAPFWAWNSRLDAAELERQITILKEMGFGGFFMHSRVGLDTEFLGKEGDEDPDFIYDEITGEWYMAICRLDRVHNDIFLVG